MNHADSVRINEVKHLIKLIHLLKFGHFFTELSSDELEARKKHYKKTVPRIKKFLNRNKNYEKDSHRKQS